jgi:hypothetical protein
VFGRRIMTNPQTEIPLQIAAQVLPSFNCDCEAGVNSRRQFSSVVKMLRFVEATADSSLSLTATAIVIRVEIGFGRSRTL